MDIFPVVSIESFQHYVCTGLFVLLDKVCCMLRRIPENFVLAVINKIQSSSSKAEDTWHL